MQKQENTIEFEQPEKVVLDNGNILTYKRWKRTGTHSCKGYDKDGRNYALYIAIAGRLEGEIITPANDKTEAPEIIREISKETLKVNKYEYGEKTTIFNTKDPEALRTLRAQCEANKTKDAYEALMKEQGTFKETEKMTHEQAKSTAVAKALNPE